MVGPPVGCWRIPKRETAFRPGAGVHRERGAGPGGAERGEGGMMGTRDAEREVGTVWSLEVCRLAGAEHLPGPARQHVWARL